MDWFQNQGAPLRLLLNSDSGSNKLFKLMIAEAWEKTVEIVTPRAVRRLLLPLSCVVFFGGLVISSTFYFRGRPIDFKAAVISDLESPEDNPGGYAFAAAGTAACAILLIPVVVLSHSRLRVIRPKRASVGAAFLAVGLASAIAIGCLAPFTNDYTPVHIQLAFTAFIGICSGTLVCSTIAIIPALAAGNRSGPGLVATVAVQGGVILFLVYLYFTPHFFNHKGLLTSLAFWEWLLCADCVFSLWMLATALDRTSAG